MVILFIQWSSHLQYYSTNNPMLLLIHFFKHVPMCVWNFSRFFFFFKSLSTAGPLRMTGGPQCIICTSSCCQYSVRWRGWGCGFDLVHCECNFLDYRSDWPGGPNSPTMSLHVQLAQTSSLWMPSNKPTCVNFERGKQFNTGAENEVSLGNLTPLFSDPVLKTQYSHGSLGNKHYIVAFDSSSRFFDA